MSEQELLTPQHNNQLIPTLTPPRKRQLHALVGYLIVPGGLLTALFVATLHLNLTDEVTNFVSQLSIGVIAGLIVVAYDAVT